MRNRSGECHANGSGHGRRRYCPHLCDWKTCPITFKLNDPARGEPRLQPQRDGRVRCSTWLGELWRQGNDARILMLGNTSGRKVAKAYFRSDFLSAQLRVQVIAININDLGS